MIVVAALVPHAAAQSHGAVTTLAGSGSAGSADGTGTAASFNHPYGVAVSPDGLVVYVGDITNHLIRAIVVATGAVTTLAGSGLEGSADGTGTAATFRYPYEVAPSPDGLALYVADTNNHLIREIVIATGAVTTLAGSGSQGFADGTGTAASFYHPTGVVASPDQRRRVVYVADHNNHRIREVHIFPPSLSPGHTPTTTPSTRVPLSLPHHPLGAHRPGCPHLSRHGPSSRQPPSPPAHSHTLATVATAPPAPPHPPRSR